MIVGLGVDAFDVCRMERVLREGEPGLTADLFTDAEIAVGRLQRDPARHFAARFAAKEAIVKALAADDAGGAPWHHIELRTAPGGCADRPQVLLHGPVKALADSRHVTRVLVSLSHARSLAMAAVILEGQDDCHAG